MLLICCLNNVKVDPDTPNVSILQPIRYEQSYTCKNCAIIFFPFSPFQPFKRGTAKQTVCLSLSPDEETVLQRLSEEEANGKQRIV